MAAAFWSAKYAIYFAPGAEGAAAEKLARAALENEKRVKAERAAAEKRVEAERVAAKKRAKAERFAAEEHARDEERARAAHEAERVAAEERVKFEKFCAALDKAETFIVTKAALEAARIAKKACDEAEEHLAVVLECVEASRKGDYCFNGVRGYVVDIGNYHINSSANRLLKDAEEAFKKAKCVVDEDLVNITSSLPDYVRNDHDNFCDFFTKVYHGADAHMNGDLDDDNHYYKYVEEYNGDDKAKFVALLKCANVAESMSSYTKVGSVSVARATYQSLEFFRLAKCAEEMATVAKRHNIDASAQASKRAKEAATPVEIAAAQDAALDASIYTKLRRFFD